MLPLLKFFRPGLGPMWPFPLSALRKCTSYFENGVILVLLRMVTFFIILSLAFEFLGFRLNVVDYQAVGVSSDVITDWWVGPERELCWLWWNELGYWYWQLSLLTVGYFLPERRSHAGPWVEVSGWLWWTELGYWCWQLSLLIGDCQALEQVMLSHSFFHSAIPVAISKDFVIQDYFTYLLSYLKKTV